MSSKDFDFGQFYQDTIANLEQSTPTRQEMLDEVRESLRGLRQGLKLYADIAGPQRTALHRDTLDEHIELWKEYSNDDVGLYEDSDIIELVAQVRASNIVQSTVFEQYATGKTVANAETSTGTAGRSASGCMMWLTLAVGATALSTTAIVHAWARH